MKIANGFARRCRGFSLSAAVLALPAATLAANTPDTSWPTYRGSGARTGSLDDQAGPKAPKVRWAYKAPEQFIASPVPTAKSLYVSGLGAFNTPQFHALAMDADAPDRVLWSKTAPFITLPTVSSPAVVDGLLLFGDGMHQTDGAIMYCLRADTGRPVWQYPVPGHLVHIEGAPTVDKGRIYFGGGDAGVICLDVNKAQLDGREMDLPSLQKLVDQKWKELTEKYEQEKKTNPDFAVAPGDEALPKPSPKLIWQKGKSAWHVDSAIAVADGRVYVSSAYIEEDHVGKRIVICLNENDGSRLWELPVPVNPWAGPTVAGDLVLVGCSSIRFDKKLVPGAKGEVIAIDSASGAVKWRKEIPGGVLGPIAFKDGLAVFTATDGKVRALDAKTGADKWSYTGGSPFFAGPAVAGGSVYVADLKGIAHALKLADGTKQWMLDVPTDPAVQAPGTVFGSPVVYGGEVYLATNNLDSAAGEAAQQTPSVVVCLSDKAPSRSAGPVASIKVDSVARTITIPCKVAPRKLPSLKEIYPLEVVATYPTPLGQKAHETVVVFDVKPSDVHKALESFGLKPGTPARGEDVAASGPALSVSLVLPGVRGKPQEVPIEKAMIDKRTGKPLPGITWHFTGSVLRQPDPDKPDKVYAADLTGTLIALYPVTDEVVVQSNLTMKENALLKLETNAYVLPPEGTPLEMVIRVK